MGEGKPGVQEMENNPGGVVCVHTPEPGDLREIRNLTKALNSNTSEARDREVRLTRKITELRKEVAELKERIQHMEGQTAGEPLQSGLSQPEKFAENEKKKKKKKKKSRKSK